MSRIYCSYDEEWQRRKAVLIRSLFHDVPILSPVTEESTVNETLDFIQNGDVINDVPFRSESPLPPLIIEKVINRNKHDEPEEYYQRLLPKIRRLYKKLFIENKDLSSEDFNFIRASNDDLIESYGENDINLDLTEYRLEDNSNFDQVQDVGEDLESIDSNEYAAQAMETGEVLSSNGTDYRQITTKAMIHVDGAKNAEERESRIYEDSVKSIILPTRKFKRPKEVRNVDVEDEVEEYAGMEDNEDPASTTTLDTDESIEVMRTPRPEISQESMPRTRCSDSESSTTYTAGPKELTDVTSSDGDDDNNMSELKTSDENEMYPFIYNQSGNTDENPQNSVPMGRKRKLYEDISVQTSGRVTWDELRGNFFVGTPKVFRLCSCVGHICDSIE